MHNIDRIVTDLTAGELKKNTHLHYDVDGYDVEIKCYSNGVVLVAVERRISHEKQASVWIFGPKKDVPLSRIVKDTVELIEKYLDA
jgi:hypothetical protein